MKHLGSFVIATGIIIAVAGFTSVDFVGWLATGGYICLGVIAVSVGVICKSQARAQQRFDDVAAQLSELKKIISSQDTMTAGQIVEQLRQEGLVEPEAEFTSEKEIVSFLE